MTSSSADSTPLFRKEQINDIERLLKEIGSDDEADEVALVSAMTGRQRGPSRTTQVKHESERERRSAAQRDRDEMWKKHIENVNKFLDEQKRDTRQRIAARRKFKQSKRIGQASISTAPLQQAREATDVSLTDRQLFGHPCIGEADLEDFLEDKVSGPLPDRLRILS